MAPFTETGHGKNAANFETLIAYCVGYDTKYNPTKAIIKMIALNAKSSEANNWLGTINLVSPVYSDAVNSRNIVFDPLDILFTQVLNAVSSSEVTDKFIANVKTVIRKLQGERAKPKKGPVADNPDVKDQIKKNISVSQLSFDNRVENMDKLIKLLANEPNYVPNEIEVSIATLTAIHSNMRTTNRNVITAFIPLNKARKDRDKSFYHEKTGLVAVSKLVKIYVKSVFKANSPEFKQISKLEFKVIKS